MGVHTAIDDLKQQGGAQGSEMSGNVHNAVHVNLRGVRVQGAEED